MAKSRISYNDDGTLDFQCSCDILDKKQGARDYVNYMLDRTNQMFEYDNLPDTIPAAMLELFLQINGSVALTEVNGELYAFTGGAGGAPDPYYRPTFYVIANPALNIGQSFRIVNHLPPYDRSAWSRMQPCILMRNDTRMRGLIPLYSRYATQMVENDVSIRSAQINARQQTLIAAANGAELDAAKKYIEDLEAGKFAVVGQRPFLDGITAENVATQSSNSIIQLIELQQYLKASWYNELGLNHAFNMKREYVSAEEIAASTDMLLPLVDDMLLNREIALDAVNKEFGTNISVHKNSAWEMKEEEMQAGIEAEQQEGGEQVESTESSNVD